MLDFLMRGEDSHVSRRSGDTTVYIYPEFRVRASKDLMIRGKDFYAIWNEATGFWSTDEDTALSLIDDQVKIFAEEYKKEHPDYKVIPMYTYKSTSGVIDNWHKYVQKQMRDHYHQLDEKLIFAGGKANKKDYASRALSYPLEEGDISAYDKLMSVLYSEEERHKIEWAIGAIVTGDSKKIQKFLVLYGSAGTGKSTVLNIIQDLFDGYCSSFDSRALGSATNAFALEAFQSNPLVAIQHDGDLSRIEDNTRLNSIVSHEKMRVNEKFKATYEAKFNCFLFMGTNKPVKITDAKSGIIRRLIDVSPTGNKVPIREYTSLMAQIKFELGAIAWHCKEVYLNDPHAYDEYVPLTMIDATNDMYNFVEENYFDFKNSDYITLNEAYKRYKEFCEESRVSYPLSKRVFKEELKNYFKEFKERGRDDQGSQIRYLYSNLKVDKFGFDKKKPTVEIAGRDYGWLDLQTGIPSPFDILANDYPAQYANSEGTPLVKWADCKTTLKDISTEKLHYVKVPENHIVIDFDIKDENGNKCFDLNAKAAMQWPPTYAETSKSGQGIHLHYIYNGDVTKLSRIFDTDIEVKVFSGNSSLRRMLTKCNDISIASINSGLPLKGDTKVVNWDGIKSEKQLRTMVIKNLKKEYHAATKPSVDYIYTLLDEAYNSGMHYDISDLQSSVIAFAAGSTHQAPYCLTLTTKMKFKSDEPSENSSEMSKSASLVFYDVEVFPNLFLVNWKYEGSRNCSRMINPTSEDIEQLCKFNLVGFNNRRYDNHILYARMMGYSNEQLFELSKKIVSGENRNCFFGEAYNLSYTDVYDFCSTKQSLKKWEIELGIHHQELGLPWDQPVPEELWEKVAQYCDNDVFATEAVFHARKADFVARQILAELSGLTVNDTTNQHTTRIIFGKEKHPQSQFNYRDLSKPVSYTEYEDYRARFGDDYNFRLWNEKGQPVYESYIPGEVLPEGWSILPFFPGYKFEFGKSIYRGEEVGEGGYVYSEPGMYTSIALDDIASMHPHSLKAEKHFGPYNKNFEDLIDSRIAVKHDDKKAIEKLLNGKLVPFVEKAEAGNADYTMDDLAYALKIAINSVYGLTSAKFENPFRDPRNNDNIVAKRGALFMINLKHEVQERGYKVAHIKTDSIKVPNADDYILDFIRKYGKEYGYTFEYEANYDRMCLVNDAVYIARYDELGDRTKHGKHANEWTATGTQFQVPYVFKTLFSKEKVEFKDLCETKSVTSSLYLDMNEGLPDGEHNYIFVGKVGSFCPIKPGCGGGILLREKEGKYSAATGSKGFRWLEAETVSLNHKENDIDESYYIKLVDEAIKSISQYGDFEWFVSNDKGE